jgi:hypothetical protein
MRINNMNLHFLSFLLDIFSWLVGGFIYGKYISKFDRLNDSSSDIASAKMALVALLGGLIATAERALPIQGFSIYHFAIAMIYAFVYSLKYFGRFRKVTFRKINFTIKLFIKSPLFKKVYSFK